MWIALFLDSITNERSASMNPLIHTEVDIYLRRLIEKHMPTKEDPENGSSHGRKASSNKKEDRNASPRRNGDQR